MYAEVVVLTYQSPEIDAYTYLIPKELEKEIKVGQLIEVPFGKRNPLGIIIATYDRHPRESEDQILNPFNVQGKQVQDDKKVVIKPISKIVLENPLLLPYQIELIKWMSSYYLAPMVNCLNAILPELPSKLLMVHGSWHKQNKTINYELSTVNQSLILVPSINRIPETLAKFPKAKNYVVYHNELKTSEKFAIWTKIKSGEVDYIFGSRSAIFTPCSNLKQIIIYDEHDGAYKDERSPYFDTLTVAQKISQLTKTQIKIVDPSPKITTFLQLPKNIKIQKFPNSTHIVNMEKERLSGNRSLVSFDLEEEIREILENKGEILLFLNKKKESGHFFCKSCKNSEFLQKQPDICPSCKSPDIFWNVLNITTLASEVIKLFPKTQVNLITDNNRLTTNDLPAGKAGKGLTQIDIGTAFSLYAQLVKKYDLIAHIQTDSLINLADFSSGEKLFAQITSLKKLLKTSGKLILQTYKNENPAIELSTQNNYPSFFQAELSQRKSLNYPPFGLLVKLTLRGKNHEKIQKEASAVYGKLLSNINHEPLALSPSNGSTMNLPAGKAGHQPLTILGPYQSIFWQKYPSYHIILKYRLVSYSLINRQEAVSDINNLISNLPKGWLAEVEPNSIQ